MAGHGPPPKDPDKRVRYESSKHASGQTNAQGLRVLELVVAKQPDLPARMPDGRAWPVRTRTWWKDWAKTPLSSNFTAIDWSELLDTAVLHGRHWSGDEKVAGELRLRVAKFGATPEDRARLRITFAEADAAESRNERLGESARDRRGPLRVLPAVGE